MSYEPTEKNITAFFRDRLPEGVEDSEEDAFFGSFEEQLSERDDEYYEFVVKHVESGKCYKMLYNYSSWDGVDSDYPVDGPREVVAQLVTITQWVPAK